VAALKCAGVIAAGVAFAVVTTFPDQTAVATNMHHLGPSDLLRAIQHLAGNPGSLLGSVLGTRHPVVCVLALLLLAACLLGDGPVLVFFATGALGTSLMFDLVYASSEDRHRGVFLIFVVALLWIRLDPGAPAFRATVLPRAAISAIVVALFLDQIAIGALRAAEDYQNQVSSCPALGALLRSTPHLRRAVVIGEPDYLIEALPLYADNDIYIPRERRFGKTVRFTTASRPVMSLDDLLASARSLEVSLRRPVVIVLGSELALSPDSSFERHYSYNRVFSYSKESYDEFARSVSQIGTFTAAVRHDENFTVYEMR
jgi:hypothetical protein